MTTKNPAYAARIAVPYYGTLSAIPSRLTRIFFLVDVDLGKNTIADLSLEVWNPERAPTLSSWLREMGTDGVICSDAHVQQTAAFIAEGIWVQSQQEGEVHEVVERWMRSISEVGGRQQHAAPPSIPLTGCSGTRRFGVEGGVRRDAKPRRRAVAAASA
jgi:predicted Fe-Mo cluster-binding NifX family protein